MRTVVVVGLVIGPVLLLGAPVALASGVTPPPSWTAPGAFVLAGVAAVGGIALLVLSFRNRRGTLPSAAPTSLPATAEPVAAESVAVEPATARPAAAQPTAEPAVGPRTTPLTVVTRPGGSRYLTPAQPERPVRGPAAFAHTPGGAHRRPEEPSAAQPAPTAPVAPARSRYVTLKPRRGPSSRPGTRAG